MSTSTYYNFIGSTEAGGAASKAALNAKGPISIKTPAQLEAVNQIDLHRQSAMSPSSFTTSASNSSSSLNSQFNSLTPNSTASSSSSSSSPSSASSTASATNLAAVQRAGQMTIANGGGAAQPRSMIFSGGNQQHQRVDLVRQSSATPTQMAGGQHQQQQQSLLHHQLHHSYTLHSLEPKPLKPFKSQSAYVEAMKEDLAEWLNSIYADLELTADNFFAQLETGAIICRHANNVTQMGRNVMIEQAAAAAAAGSTTAATSNSDAGSSGSDNENSLGHQETATGAAAAGHLSSPSPEHEGIVVERRASNSNNNQFYRRHRHSTTHSSISSLATSCSGASASRQRLSLTGGSPAGAWSPRNERAIVDWFRVKLLTYKPDARPGTFFARDNICQFILWCRSLNIIDCLLFETDDLVARKNEKSFILCLLEVARIGFKVGMPTPLIIQLEQEIDREIENDAKRQRAEEEEDEEEEMDDERRRQSDDASRQEYPNNDCGLADSNDNDGATSGLAAQVEQQLELNNNEQLAAESSPAAPLEDKEDGFSEEDFGPKPQVITNDLLSLHERVVQLLCQCSCPTQFPMVRIGDGKYKVGDKLIIFVRILRRHIMVRVGGGWQELSEFLRQKDPCRTRSPNQNYFSSPQQNGGAAHSPRQTAPSTPPLTSSVTVHETPTSMNGNGGGGGSSSGSTSIPVSRSRLLGSGHHLNRTHRYHGHSPSGGRRLISGSASMSWLSHNS